MGCIFLFELYPLHEVPPFTTQAASLVLHHLVTRCAKQLANTWGGNEHTFFLCRWLPKCFHESRVDHRQSIAFDRAQQGGLER